MQERKDWAALRSEAMSHPVATALIAAAIIASLSILNHAWHERTMCLMDEYAPAVTQQESDVLAATLTMERTGR